MICVNGEDMQFVQSMTLAEFLEKQNYQIGRVVVEKNGEIIPKSNYSAVTVNDGDKLEILNFVGGG